MRRFTCLLLLLVMGLNGCAYWAALSVPPEQALSPDDGPHHVRLRMLDSSMVELRFALVDSLTISGRRDWPVKEYIEVSRDSVASIEVQRASAANAAIPLLAIFGLFLVGQGIGNGAVSGIRVVGGR